MFFILPGPALIETPEGHNYAKCCRLGPSKHQSGGFNGSTRETPRTFTKDIFLDRQLFVRTIAQAIVSVTRDLSGPE